MRIGKRKIRFATTLTVFLILFCASMTLAQEQLSETFSDRQSLFSFHYPEGWNAGGAGELAYVSNTDDAFALSFAILAGDQEALKTGQISISMISAPLQRSEIDLKSFDKDMALKLIKSQFAMVTSEVEVQITRSPTQRTVTGRKAVEFTNIMGKYEQFQLLILFNRESFIWLTATTPVGELEQQEASILAIAQTLEYAAPVRVGFIPDDGPGADLGTDDVIWELQRPADYFLKEGFGFLGDVEIGVDDTIFVLDDVHDSIKVMSSDGDVLGTIVNNILEPGVQDIALAADGTIWATDKFNHAIHHLDQQGNLLFSIDVGRPGSGPGQFAANSPDSIVVASNGDLYVFDGQGDSDNRTRDIGRIEVFDSSGHYLREFPLFPEDINRFSDEVILVMDSQDNLYASDYSDEIRVFDTTGTLLKQWRVNDVGNRLLNINALAVSNEGNIGVTTAQGFIYELNIEGQIISTYGHIQGSGSNDPFALGEYGEIGGIGFFSNGDVVVSAYSMDEAKVIRFRFEH